MTVGREWLVFSMERDGRIADRHAIAFETAGEVAEAAQRHLDNKSGLGAILIIDPSLHPADVRALLLAALALRCPPQILKYIDSENRQNWDGSPSDKALATARENRLTLDPAATADSDHFWRRELTIGRVQPSQVTVYALPSDREG